jgi:hypothetical protein
VNDLWYFDLGTRPFLFLSSFFQFPFSFHLISFPSAGSKRWEEVATADPSPCPRYGHTAVAFGTSLLLFGGADRSYQPQVIPTIFKLLL